MSDRNTRALARELARLQRRLDRFETHSQGWARSVEESSLDFYDENDLLRLSIGKQADGSYSVRSPEGEVPPAPTEPDVINLGDGLVVVTWDGRFEERYSGDFRNVRVHIDSDGGAAFVPSRNNQVGAIWARRGGSIVAVTESDVDNAVYVKLVATNNAGQVGPASDAVLVDEADEDGIGEDEEELEWEADDYYVLTAGDVTSGIATIPLSEEPEVESVVLVLGGVPQQPTEYTVNYEARTITFPLAGWETAGLRFWVHYAYQRISGGVIVPFATSGWRHLQVAKSDSTDRSGTAFDDSTWAVAAAPFGDGAQPPYSWPNYVSPWAAATSLWTRRQVAVDPQAAVVITVRSECAVIYWNGTQVGTFGNPNADSPGVEYEVVIPTPDVLATNVLAVRYIDDNVTDSGAGCYGDTEVRYQ